MVFATFFFRSQISDLSDLRSQISDLCFRSQISDLRSQISDLGSHFWDTSPQSRGPISHFLLIQKHVKKPILDETFWKRVKKGVLDIFFKFFEFFRSQKRDLRGCAELWEPRSEIWDLTKTALATYFIRSQILRSEISPAKSLNHNMALIGVST